MKPVNTSEECGDDLVARFSHERRCLRVAELSPDSTMFFMVGLRKSFISSKNAVEESRSGIGGMKGRHNRQRFRQDKQKRRKRGKEGKRGRERRMEGGR